MGATKRNRNKVRLALRGLPPGLSSRAVETFRAGMHKHLARAVNSSPNSAGKVKAAI